MANCKVYIKQLYKIDAKWKLMFLILVTSLSFMLYDWRFYLINLFITSWITLTTPSSAIIEGLTSLLKPLSYIGLKPSKVSMSFALAIRFMGLITDTFAQVKIAQKAKGIDKILLIPLIIQAIKMANNIAEAIEARS